MHLSQMYSVLTLATSDIDEIAGTYGRRPVWNQLPVFLSTVIDLSSVTIFLKMIFMHVYFCELGHGGVLAVFI